ncbi:MAG: hypothetical protein KatS3mg111_3029 [Pirellulaceae bacterium]|nr:MAG: hypothetical protein KatS3mg111_3029 [Pirellulaceae bacterium]
MLILSRKRAQQICLGDDIVVTVVSVGQERVRLCISAPDQVRILRAELKDKPMLPPASGEGKSSEVLPQSLPARSSATPDEEMLSRRAA